MEACVKLIDKAWVLPQESLQASLDLIETERRLLRSGSGEDDLSNSELLGPYDGKVIAELRQTYGLSDDTLSENTALMGLTGFSSDSYVMGMYLVAAILFALVLAAGVFMIAGSLNSRTAERTQFFGMLRCIGVSRVQIMHIVRLEALYWCKTAVPIGVGIGIVGTWILGGLLRFCGDCVS